jgi:hypothetical protein
MKTPLKTIAQEESVMTDPVRRGIYLLPAAGILTLVPWLFILGPAVKTDPQAYARSVTSTGHMVAGYVYIAGFICLLIGLFALYGYLVRSRASTWAAAGMIVSVVAITLALPIFGVVGLANQVLADVYLGGQKDVSSAMVLMAGGTFSDRINNYFGVIVLVSLIGAIANAVAIWRSGTLPKVAGIFLPAGFVLSMTISPGIAWAGALLLVVGGAWLAISISQAQTAPGVRFPAAAPATN